MIRLDSLLEIFINVSQKERSVPHIESSMGHVYCAAKEACTWGFRIGHSSPNFAIPMGTQAALDATGKKLHISPGVAAKEAIT